MDNTMTVFYMKSSGAIKETCSGKQSFDYFGDEKKDYKKIYDYIHVEETAYILNHITNMRVVDGKLRFYQGEIPVQYLG